MRSTDSQHAAVASGVDTDSALLINSIVAAKGAIPVSGCEPCIGKLSLQPVAHVGALMVPVLRPEIEYPDLSSYAEIVSEIRPEITCLLSGNQ